jgi:hypothetical protein
VFVFFQGRVSEQLTGKQRPLSAETGKDDFMLHVGHLVTDH